MCFLSPPLPRRVLFLPDLVPGLWRGHGSLGVPVASLGGPQGGGTPAFPSSLLRCTPCKAHIARHSQRPPWGRLAGGLGDTLLLPASWVLASWGAVRWGWGFAGLQGCCAMGTCRLAGLPGFPATSDRARLHSCVSSKPWGAAFPAWQRRQLPARDLTLKGRAAAGEVRLPCKQSSALPQTYRRHLGLDAFVKQINRTRQSFGDTVPFPSRAPASWCVTARHPAAPAH